MEATPDALTLDSQTDYSIVHLSFLLETETFHCECHRHLLTINSVPQTASVNLMQINEIKTRVLSEIGLFQLIVCRQGLSRLRPGDTVGRGVWYLVSLVLRNAQHS